jgi:hypothetical protein
MQTPTKITRIRKYRIEILLILAVFFLLPDPAEIAKARALGTSELITTSLPAAPSNLQVTMKDATTVFLTWQDNSTNETGFVVYDGSLWITTTDQNVNSNTIENLIPNSSHCYQVIAYNENGNSELSNEACINLTSKPGDANGDSNVDGIDYVIWLNHYGQNVSGGPSVGDFNGDGKVDGIDYVIWLNNFGK